MDTKTTNDSFLWSFTENECSLCSRQIGIGNGVPGAILPCCQQVVCEDCYKNELLKKSNGSCPFCFFKGESKPQKASITMNNIMNSSNQPNLTVRTVPNGGSASNTNPLPTVGSGLPLDLSCWLPQNLTAICNPGYQSNSTTTCAASPYYKSNTTTGDAFNQDNFMYMRGNSIPGVVCTANQVNVGIGGQNINAPSGQPQSFGSISDGFWNHSANSASINNSSNHNSTGSSTAGSFISDPWISSTGGYSPANGFLHDFGGYENNTNNINPNNISCKKGENSTEDVPNISGAKTSSKSNNSNATLNSGQNTKFINCSGINNIAGINNNINDNNNCDLVVGSDYNKDGIYSSNINMNSFVQGTQGLNTMSNNTITDIYNSNSMYTWTVQNPISCNGIDSFSQVNDQEDNISSASVDMDFQRFCLGLGFDINNPRHPNTPDTHCKDVLLGEKVQVRSDFEHNFNKNNGNSADGDNFKNIQSLPKTNSSNFMDYSVDSNENIDDTYKSKICDIENKMESIDLKYNFNKDSQSICDRNINDNSVINGDNNGNNDNSDMNNENNTDIDSNKNNDDNNYINNESNNNDTNYHLNNNGNNVNNGQNNKSTVDNSHLFNNSAFPPLTSAIIKQLPSKDIIKASNIANSHQNDGFISLVGQNLSGNIPGSNQNINNNNPIASSNPRLLTIKGTRTDNVTRNIGGTLSGNNGKQNITGSVKVGIINNLGASTGNASYIDAVLHKGEANTTGVGGRSDNSTSTNIGSDLTNPSGEIPVNPINTDEDLSVSLGVHGEPYNYKRALCRHWMRGYCWLEADCKFAHGEAELRTRDGKLRHPTLSISVGSESSRQNQVQAQFQSPTQVSSNENSSMGSTGGSSTTSALTSTGAVVVSPDIHQKTTKQLGIKSTGTASYAATAASSLTSSVLNNDSNISYSVMVVSGASNLDSKR
ncbi:HC-23 protein [Cryptosporidium ryanae]|uniref:HC-23 protein n=1 Tax=Cryptosporidium ryanae TaxID=515981 RepID=UPI00351A617B|nr:HC-23 protein [Cryptosporidium ryanae]